MTVTPEQQRLFLSLLSSQKSIEQTILQQEPCHQRPSPDSQVVPDPNNQDMFVLNGQSVDYDKVPSFTPNEKLLAIPKKTKRYRLQQHAKPSLGLYSILLKL
jgi:hypothetical protein